MGWWPSRAVTFLENHDTVIHPCTHPAFLTQTSASHLTSPVNVKVFRLLAFCAVHTLARVNEWWVVVKGGHSQCEAGCLVGVVQGSTQGHWRFPSSGLEQGYCYVLTHPGTPCIFYDHLEDPQLANTIQRLIALRLRAGIHCRSQVPHKPPARTCYCSVAPTGTPEEAGVERCTVLRQGKLSQSID